MPQRLPELRATLSPRLQLNQPLFLQAFHNTGISLLETGKAESEELQRLIAQRERAPDIGMAAQELNKITPEPIMLRRCLIDKGLDSSAIENIFFRLAAQADAEERSKIIRHIAQNTTARDVKEVLNRVLELDISEFKGALGRQSVDVTINPALRYPQSIRSRIFAAMEAFWGSKRGEKGVSTEREFFEELVKKLSVEFHRRREEMLVLKAEKTHIIGERALEEQEHFEFSKVGVPDKQQKICKNQRRQRRRRL